VACDHYHRWPEDIELMKRLGLKAYRFSIAWPRIYPQGRGTLNRAGIDFYSRLVDALLAAGIEPYITLYHWDLPQALDEAGGWLARETAYVFADYAETMVKHLGDRVQHWSTFNEPWCVSFLSYQLGIHAPGLRDERLAVQAAHHVLVAHGLALQTMRAVHAGLKAGIVLNLWSIESVEDTPASRALIERAWQRDLGWFLDPLLHAEYPLLAWQERDTAAPPLQPGDMKLIAQPLDWLGINNYTPLLDRRSTLRGFLAEYKNGWEVGPGWCVHLLKLRQRYPLPLYIIENGAAPGRLTPGGVPDPSIIIARLHHGVRSQQAGGCARLFCLVAAGQLRVGVRLRQTLWRHLRGLSYPAPRDQRQRLLVRTGDRSEWKRQTDTTSRKHLPGGALRLRSDTLPGPTLEIHPAWPPHCGNRDPT
jgi:beta-glucosidase